MYFRTTKSADYKNYVPKLYGLWEQYQNGKVRINSYRLVCSAASRFGLPYVVRGDTYCTRRHRVLLKTQHVYWGGISGSISLPGGCSGMRLQIPTVVIRVASDVQSAPHIGKRAGGRSNIAQSAIFRDAHIAPFLNGEMATRWRCLNLYGYFRKRGY